MSYTRTLFSTVALFIATAGASTATAQATQATAPADITIGADSKTNTSGPRMEQTGIRRNIATAGFAAAAARPVSMGKPMALMIVGGAAVILGILIGSEIGQLVMLGGAVAFLIGLYEYVK